MTGFLLKTTSSVDYLKQYETIQGEENFRLIQLICKLALFCSKVIFAKTKQFEKYCSNV